jgi:hypothetical protein
MNNIRVDCCALLNAANVENRRTLALGIRHFDSPDGFGRGI